MDFIWYQKISNSNIIEQGDIIDNCPIVIPPSKIEDGAEAEIDIKLIDSIVLSQSCDLLNNKIEIVLVCPYYPLKIFLENLPENQKNKKNIAKHIDRLRKGHLPSYHLLDKFEEFEINDYLVVDFRNVYGIQIDNLKALAGKYNERIRLSPPYREHLSQAFARYFMRVGLPQDIIVEGY